MHGVVNGKAYCVINDRCGGVVHGDRGSVENCSSGSVEHGGSVVDRDHGSVIHSDGKRYGIIHSARITYQYRIAHAATGGASYTGRIDTRQPPADGRRSE